jgi:hypothetical protein
MARWAAEEIATSNETTSSRFVTGTKVLFGDCMATAEPVVEQTGQMCKAEGGAVRSEQKWNCNVRKRTPTSKIRRHVCRGATGI